MTQTFEEFLVGKHAEQYSGVDDDMGEDFEDWSSRLDVQEVMDYAEEWHRKQSLSARLDEMELNLGNRIDDIKYELENLISLIKYGDLK